jgi:hypothetical protein
MHSEVSGFAVPVYIIEPMFQEVKEENKGDSAICLIWRNEAINGRGRGVDGLNEYFWEN